MKRRIRKAHNITNYNYSYNISTWEYSLFQVFCRYEVVHHKWILNDNAAAVGTHLFQQNNVWQTATT